jgi:hypothetical protein
MGRLNFLINKYTCRLVDIHITLDNLLRLCGDEIPQLNKNEAFVETVVPATSCSIFPFPRPPIDRHTSRHTLSRSGTREQGKVITRGFRFLVLLYSAILVVCIIQSIHYVFLASGAAPKG